MLRYEDIFEKDLWDKLKAQLEEVIAIVKNLKSELLDVGKALAAQGIKASTQDLQEAIRVYNELIEVLKAYNSTAKIQISLGEVHESLEKRISRAVRERVAQTTEEYKLLTKLQVANREYASDLRKAIKEENALREATELLEKAKRREFEGYADLSETLEKLRVAYKSLVVTGKGNTELAQELSRAIRSLDAEIKRVDASVGQFQRNVGDYFNQFSSAIQTNIITLAGLGDSFQNVQAVAAQTLTSIINRLIVATSVAEGLRASLTLLKGALAGLGIAAIVDLLVLMTESLKGQSLEVRKGLQELEKERDVFERIKSLQSAIRASEEEVNALVRARYFSVQAIENAIASINRKMDFQRQIVGEIAQAEYERLGILIENARLRLEEERGTDKELDAAKELFELEKQRSEIGEKLRNQLDELNKKQEAAVEVLRQRQKEILELQRRITEFISASSNELTESLRSALDLPQELKKQYEEALLVVGKAVREAFDAKVLTLQMARINGIFENLKSRVEEIGRSGGISLLQDEFSGLVDRVSAAQKALAQLREEILVAEKELKAQNKLTRDIADGFQLIREQITNTEKALARLEAQGAMDIALKNLQGNLSEIVSLYRQLAQTTKDTVIAGDALTKAAEREVELRKRTLEAQIEVLNKQKMLIAERVKEGIISEETGKELIAALEERIRLTERLRDLQGEIIGNQLKESLRTLYESESKKIEESINRRYDLLKKRIEATYVFAGDRERELRKLEKERMIELIAAYDELANKRRLTDDEAIRRQTLVFELQALNNQALEKLYNSLRDATEKVAEMAKTLSLGQLELINQQRQDLIGSLERDLDFLKNLAIAGNKQAFENYAKVLEEERKLREEFFKTQKELARRQAVLELIKAFSSIAAVNPVGASGHVLGFVSQIASALASIGLKEGTEYVDRRHGVFLNTARDAILTRLDIGERVIPRELNEKLGGISNEELVNRVNSNVSYDYDSLYGTLIKIVNRPGQKIIRRRYG